MVGISNAMVDPNFSAPYGTVVDSYEIGTACFSRRDAYAVNVHDVHPCQLCKKYD